MRLVPLAIFLFLSLMAAGTSAQLPATEPDGTPESRPELAAATADSLDQIRGNALQVALTPELSVRRFLDNTGGADAFDRRIETAQQRGGTRWRGPDICEVRMEISGAEVADELRKIAAANPGKVGVPVRALEPGLRSLAQHTFSAVGRSTGPGAVAQVRQADLPAAWRNITEAERRAAIEGARSSAVTRVIESLKPVELGNGSTVGDALAVKQVNEELRAWLTGRPMTRVEFDDDLMVRVTLAVDPREFWPVIQSALIRNKLGPAPDNGKAWQQVRDAVIAGMASPVGRSSALKPPTTGRAVPQPPPGAPQPVRLPAEPPKWASEQMDADGKSSGANRLKAARAAEDVALGQLRKQIDALSLGELTIGQAAKADPRIERAVAGVVRRAPTSRVQYGDGNANVRVSLDLWLLWRELSR
jgi:hypothetical protein